MNLPSFVLVLGLYLTLSFCSGSEENLDRPFILSAVEEAKKLVDDAYKYSREESLARVRRDNVRPSDVLRLMKQPAGETRSAVRAADYMAQTLRLIHDKAHHVHKRSINTTELVTPEELETIERLTGCAARVQPPSCRTTPHVNKYRTASGVCNNLKNPRLGASNTAFPRWLPAEYEDGISLPRGWDPSRLYNHFLLPLVREVSNRILSTTNAGVTSDRELSYLVAFFGQWNDHGQTFTPTSPSIRSFSSCLNCDESCERSNPCFPIRIPRGDPRFPSGPNSCLPFTRSAPVCGTGNTALLFSSRPMVREQINGHASFLDMGQVYGSEDGLARNLRDLTNDGGLLRVNNYFTDHGRELLPFSSMVGNMCATRRKITNNTDATEVPCFVAGDSRLNENLGLTSLHTLFMREHNRLARALRLLNPRWSSDTLYQEARKIMGAYLQVIMFRDYVHHIVGPDVLQRQLGSYPGYDDNIDPSIANVFATAANRFGHNTIQPLMFRLDEKYQENPQFPNVPLFETAFTPWRVVFEGGVDPLIRGMVARPSKLNQQDHMMVNALRDKLFFFTSRMAMDLGSLNMQRGRDHGLQGYNAWRRHCGLSTPQNEAELAQVLNNTDLARRLLQLYGTPANIDVWLGGVAEPFVPGGRVGPLFACLIATQFQNLRQGDRLWWEKPGVFTPKQRESLARMSLARIICDNTGISDVPSNPFLYRSRGSGFTRCNNTPLFDLTPWIELETDVTCEGLHTTLDCGNSLIQINSANYGRTDQTTCSAGRPASQVTKTDCNSDATTLSIVANSCDWKTNCSVQASNSVFSNPCLGTYKYLDISYTCILTKTSVTCEGHQSVLDCGNNLIKIHSANYGRTDQTTCSAGRPTGQVTKTNCHTPDALVKVSESCDWKTKCSVQASNSVFSDPCVGTYKYLDISYSCIPTKTSVTCEGHQSVLDCGNNLIKIHSANYGRTDQTTCSAGRPTDQITITDCHTPDALVKVSESCDGKTKCSVQASNVIFSNPCNGTFKYLDISYVCLPNMTNPESEPIPGPPGPRGPAGQRGLRGPPGPPGPGCNGTAQQWPRLQQPLLNTCSSLSEGENSTMSLEQLHRMEQSRHAALERLAVHNVSVTIGGSWRRHIGAEFTKAYFTKLAYFIAEERKYFTVYPSPEQVFSWTHMCAIEDVKVVILGQDPYHGPGQAHGLCFSVLKPAPPPPSLENIFTELTSDIEGFQHPGHGDLRGWAKQGVLLLNTVLTVQAHHPNSHQGQGWEVFTDAVVQWVSGNLSGLVFLLWGSSAQRKGSVVDKNHHHVLQTSHPSPYSAQHGFSGCRHFSRTNELLMKSGKKPIDWKAL